MLAISLKLMYINKQLFEVLRGEIMTPLKKSQSFLTILHHSFAIFHILLFESDSLKKSTSYIINNYNVKIRADNSKVYIEYMQVIAYSTSEKSKGKKNSVAFTSKREHYSGSKYT